jgi:hypothetical protein
MQFSYRGFDIECFVEQAGANFVSHATISRASSNNRQRTSYKTGYLPSSATQVKAISYARNFAEMWCDENFLDGCT